MYRLFVIACALALGLLASAALPSASAQAPKGKAGKKDKKKEGKKHKESRAMLKVRAELHDAHAQLATLQPIYGGHRGKALHQIHEAVRQLELAALHAGVTPPLPVTGPPWKVNPKQRHPILHKAIRDVRHAHKRLAGLHDKFGGHRHHALRHMDHAVREIHLAIKFVDSK